jgi:DNA adenine methylase
MAISFAGTTDPRLYRSNFSDADFADLASRLATVKGKFLLTLNDAPEIRNLFQEFRIREIAFHYSAQRAAGKRFQELLITNY